MKEINIALVAHDGRKQELLQWIRFNHSKLSKYNLYATGTTGKLISELEIEQEGELTKPFEGKVTRLLSGPLGRFNQNTAAQRCNGGSIYCNVRKISEHAIK